MAKSVSFKIELTDRLEFHNELYKHLMRNHVSSNIQLNTVEIFPRKVTEEDTSEDREC